VTEWNPSPGQLAALRETVGITDPDPSDPLHAKLINALAEAGPGSTLGQRTVACRFVINWEHRKAGADYANAKAAYEKRLTRRKTELLAEDGMAVSKAVILAEADDEVYRLKLAFLLAEQYERTLRQLLQTLDRALDNHRTDRADWRAADQAHAQGYSGGA
jgi:hypothetical protein